jgi:dihydropteroate synthase
MRPAFEWQLRTRSLKLGERTLIMGIVNVTPDSFSDGGLFLDPERAVEHGLELLAEGADILDVGGESTRPDARLDLAAEEEQKRVLPVVEGILRQAPDTIVSIDTYKAETARAAIVAGAEIVNDVSGFTWDKRMRKLLAAEQCGCVLMHTRGRPDEWRTLPSLAHDHVVQLVVNDLRRLAQLAVAAGIPRDRIILDPGFGFGKRMDENFPLLANLGALQELGFPLLSGTSRKSFTYRDAGRTSTNPADRLAGTIATVTASILQGAQIVRVHDVRSMLEPVRIADALVRSQSC